LSLCSPYTAKTQHTLSGLLTFTTRVIEHGAIPPSSLLLS
jgi:hypothetical protein